MSIGDLYARPPTLLAEGLDLWAIGRLVAIGHVYTLNSKDGVTFTSRQRPG